MEMIIQAKSLHLTRALREFIQRQGEKLKKLNLGVMKVRVYMEQATKKDSDDKKVTVKYRLEVPGKNLWIEVNGYDFYEAVVDATNAAVRKLRKSKEKSLSKREKKQSPGSLALG